MWIQHAKRAPITMAASAFDYKQSRGQSIRPCPACGLIDRSRSDKARGPVGFSNNEVAWKCYQCGAKGDVVDFMGYHFFQRPLRDLTKEETSVVRDWFAEKGFCTPSGVSASVQPDPTKMPTLNAPTLSGPKRPPFDELTNLWESTKSFEEAMNDAPLWSEPLNEWLVLRRFAPLIIDKTKCVRILPNPTEFRFPNWWPHKWAATYRIVAPVFEPNGKLASIHCRMIGGKDNKGPKTRWPLGYEAGGLLMANSYAVETMRGQASPDLSAFLICEGITDFMRACEQAHRESLKMAIVAGTSGSYKSISKIKIPKDLNIFIATDNDDQGDEYAAIICDQLPEHKLYRINLEGQ